MLAHLRSEVSTEFGVKGVFSNTCTAHWNCCVDYTSLQEWAQPSLTAADDFSELLVSEIALIEQITRLCFSGIDQCVLGFNRSLIKIMSESGTCVFCSRNTPHWNAWDPVLCCFMSLALWTGLKELLAKLFSAQHKENILQCSNVLLRTDFSLSHAADPLWLASMPLWWKQRLRIVKVLTWPSGAKAQQQLQSWVTLCLRETLSSQKSWTNSRKQPWEAGNKSQSRVLSADHLNTPNTLIYVYCRK